MKSVIINMKGYMLPEELERLLKDMNSTEITIGMSEKGLAPKVICHAVHNDLEYLLTRELDGEMACEEKYLEIPEVTAKLLAKGIKLLQSIDISDCKFYADTQYKLKVAEENIKNDKVNKDDWDKINYYIFLDELF